MLKHMHVSLVFGWKRDQYYRNDPNRSKLSFEHEDMPIPWCEDLTVLVIATRLIGCGNGAVSCAALTRTGWVETMS